MGEKYVYYFGGGTAEGDASQRNLLGGKGANLAEMCHLGLPVPPGFTISTKCCIDYFEAGEQFPESMKEQVKAALKEVEQELGLTFGDPEHPLLMSSRSGARRSMPGMMETVLNIGLGPATIPGLIEKTGDERFVYDAYRRLITMYADVVMEKAEGDRPDDEDEGIRRRLDDIMHAYKQEKGYEFDTDLTAEDLKYLCDKFKQTVREVLGRDFPDDPWDQLWGSIGAVFKSWFGKRAVSYRRIEGLPDDWGTAVNVQAMVFGNVGENSATGVAFTRNPATGANEFYGEWLPNAQGEDVVAGIRTPNPLNNLTKSEQNAHLPSLEEAMPEAYRELSEYRTRLEEHYKDMQDIEFTVQEGVLYMLQTRTGKRTGTAALNMAMDMLEEGLIDENEAVMRVTPSQLSEMLHLVVDPEAEKGVYAIATGLPAGPGGASGSIVFSADEAVAWAEKGHSVILVREETSPEDVEGMRAAVGILTSRGGMTSHAALVARGWGKCCVVGAGGITVDTRQRVMTVNGRTYEEGVVITLNGTKGSVYEGELPMIDATENPRFQDFMKIADGKRTLGVRTNADTPEDAALALEFGAEGIGLFRTEHMFYGEGSEEPLFILQKMILSTTEQERRAALDELFPYVRNDVRSTLEAMEGRPVAIRLLDPPLHEFVPKSEAWHAELAQALGLRTEQVTARSDALREINPMMGHRGVRLCVTYPEVAEMQVRAILEAAAELVLEGREVHPEIMVPVTCDATELELVKTMVDRVYADVVEQTGVEVPYLYGTMLEVPRACLLADRMAGTVDFISFGTNDLTQMTFGFSRDDVGRFLPDYLDKQLLPVDPFETIDNDAVGHLVRLATEKGRQERPELEVGICGEHGGDPASVAFCHAIGMDYVSCSPYRVPIARLAAAQAAIAGG